MKDIKVPLKWFKAMQGFAKRYDKSKKPEDLSLLLGFMKSIETIIKLNRK